MTAFPQYAKSTNLAVVGTVLANRDGVKGFHEAACAFSEAQGVKDGAYSPSSFAGTHRIRSLGGDTKPETGRWKQGYGGYGWLPFKNNPLHAEMEKIRFDEQDVPGLPGLLHGHYLPNGQQVIYSPRPFVLDGVAYVGFSGQPIESGGREAQPEEGDWEEIKASEYHAAVETYNERVKAS